MKEKNEKKTPVNTLKILEITIPSRVLFHPELTVRERVLYGILKQLSESSPDGYTYIGNTEFSEMLSVDPQIISNGIAKLRELDFIIVEYRTPVEGGGYRYKEYNGHDSWSKFRRIKIKEENTGNDTQR